MEDCVKNKVLSRRTDKTLPALLVMTYSNLLTKKSKKLLIKRRMGCTVLRTFNSELKGLERNLSIRHKNSKFQ